ncbi:MAG: ribonuclease Z [Lachnospiraceae bacterium]|nr:ribonuclease Z [Lachnospiraceae bacterium]
MTIFVCVDDHNGMLFNHRRQSRDEAVLKDMLDAAGTDIWMNGYSSKLFRKAPDRVVIEEGFLSLAPGDGYCFVENVPLGPCEDRLETLVVYCWNRAYPADTCLDIDLSRDWELTDTKEFGGTSHEKITRKTYERKKR